MNNSRALIAILAATCVATAHADPSTKSGEWPYYGGDAASSKYSPQSQIDAANVNKLKVAWTWDNPDDALLANKTTRERPGYFKSTPLMVGGVLYTSTGFAQVAAIEAHSGKTIWVFDPKAYLAGRRPTNSGWQNRGVGYWQSKDAKDKRVLIAVGIGELIALDANTGLPVKSFGKDGRVDLYAGIVNKEEDRRSIGFNAPPMVVGDVVVLGNTVNDRPNTPTMPAGHIQGFDVRTGALKWVFHTVPKENEPGVETWENDSWKYTGNTNAWSLLSADTELGIVYIPTGTPTNDYYGGHRKGGNLYAESLLAIKADTGKLLWHFQGVHHGLWDYDFPAAPNVVDINVDGKKIKAVAQISKQGFTYVFDRVTGKPVWPIEERAVPQSIVPGEKTSATQPFPTKPPAFARQGLTEDDLIDFTPELRASAKEIIKEYTYGPLFTPPTLVGEDGKKGTLQLPSAAGGANWGGAAFDPEGDLFIESANLVGLASLVKSTVAGQSDYLPSGAVGPRGVEGLPLIKPPYGAITKIDLNKGELAWQIAHGDGPRNHPLLKDLKLPALGASSHWFLSSGGPLLTKTLLFINQVQTRSDGPGLSDTEFYMHAFDKKNGALVWEYKMKEPPFGTPMTYFYKGKQYIVVATGGGGTPGRLVAFTLP